MLLSRTVLLFLTFTSRLCGALLFLLLGAGLSVASTQKIGNDLYAYISENDQSANSTFLVTTAGVLVVDTGLNEQEGRKLLAEIRKISAAPVRYIVNTHYHPDHRGGNSVVGPDATVISTAFTLSQDAGRALAYSATAGKITFTDRMALYLGGHEVEIYFPGPGHTLGGCGCLFSPGTRYCNGRPLPERLLPCYGPGGYGKLD